MCPKFRCSEEIGTYRFLGILAKNRVEWVVSDLAAVVSGVSVVALYETLGPDSSEFILNQTQLRTLVCASHKISFIAKLKKDGKCLHLSTIIYLDEPLESDLE